MTIIVSIFVITLSNTVHVNTIRVVSTIIANVCSKLKQYNIFYIFAVMSLRHGIAYILIRWHSGYKELRLFHSVDLVLGL